MAERDQSHNEESLEILALHIIVPTVLEVQEPHLIFDHHVPNE